MNKAAVLLLLAGCAQFRPPPEGASSSSGGCPVTGDSYTYADEAGSNLRLLESDSDADCRAILEL